MTESGRGREERKKKEVFACLGPSSRSFAPILPQTPELPAEEATFSALHCNVKASYNANINFEILLTGR